jgi:hypothetical protein
MSRKLAAAAGVALALWAGVARAERVLAVMPLDTKHGSLRAPVELALQDAASRVVGRAGWTTLSAEAVSSAGRCHDEACLLAVARAQKATAFVAGAVNATGGDITLTLHATDTLTGKDLGSTSYTAANVDAVVEQIAAKTAELFQQAGIAGGFQIGDDHSGALYLRADPPDVTVQVDAADPVVVVPSRPALLMLDLGRHRIVVRRQGYQDRVEDVVIQRGLASALTVALVPTLSPGATTDPSARGVIAVESTPDRAHVFLDGEDARLQTPDTVSHLLDGDHVIVLQHDDYSDWIERVTIRNGEKQTVKATLQPSAGGLTIETDPPGATVALDGRAQSERTPITLQHIEARAWHVSISMLDHGSVEKFVVLEPGSTVTLHETLAARYGTLVFKPKPDGCSVTLNDTQLTGATPFSNSQVEAGTYRVRITCEGYSDLEKSVSIVGGQSITIDDALHSTSGRLVVESLADGERLDGADVNVNGAPRGKTPLTLDRLPEGHVHVEVSAPLHQGWSGDATITSSVDAHLTAQLVRQYGLLVASSKQGGTVSLDGQVLGPANGATYKVPMGDHRLVFLPANAERYRNFEAAAHIEVGKTVSVEADPVARVGAVQVGSHPAGAAIQIDGTAAGATPKLLSNVFAGAHDLRLDLTGYVPWKGSVRVEEGKTGAVLAPLVTLEEARRDADIRHGKLIGATIAGIATGVLAGGAGVSFWAAQNYAGREAMALQQYGTATDPTAIATARGNALSALSSERAAEISSFVIAGAAAVMLGVTLYEALSMPPPITTAP